MEVMSAVMIILACAVMGGSAQLLFKAGLDPFNLIRLGIGFILYGVAFLGYLWALRSVPLTVGYPLIAVSYIIVAIGGILLLKEPYTWTKMAGSLGIILSVWLIAR